MRVVVVPASFVTTGWRLPTVCARHGEPAAQHRTVTFRKPPSGVLVILPPLVRLLLWTLQKRVTAPACPFCDRCTKMRTTRVSTAIGLIGLAIAIIILVSTAAEDFPNLARKIAIFVPISLIMYIIGLRVATMSTLSQIANGYLSRDGMQLEFRNPHPTFVEQVTAAKTAAAQYWAAAAGVPAAQVQAN